MINEKKYLMFLFVMLLSVSCQSCDFYKNHQKVTGTLVYSVSSVGFSSVDNIEYKNIDGTLIDTGKINLPWSQTFNFDNVDTYSIDPATLHVTINSTSNTSGGTLTTNCDFSQNYRNGDSTATYSKNVGIEQDVFARIYPNNF